MDREVGEWLRKIADRYFAGNMSLALNEMLHIPMAMQKAPDDMWADAWAHKAAMDRGQAEIRRQNLTKRPDMFNSE